MKTNYHYSNFRKDVELSRASEICQYGGIVCMSKMFVGKINPLHLVKDRKIVHQMKGPPSESAVGFKQET
ncbi:hypothetical protein [Ureibacillus thermosphaericus]|uniref:hypothetical protein n=1 Tax=Ureibacillus thermosphaericus TaxID=51173 RepID=UPI0030C9158A